MRSAGYFQTDVLLEAARIERLDPVVTGKTPGPRLLDVIDLLSARIKVEVVADRPLVELIAKCD